MRWFYILQGFGALGAFIFIVGGGYYLPILQYKINLLLGYRLSLQSLLRL